jgi:hypothetical protein
MEKCEARDPQNPKLVANIGAAYCSLRMWSHAKRAGFRALAIDPHSLLGLQTVIFASLNGTGDLDEAKARACELSTGSESGRFQRHRQRTAERISQSN